MKSFTVSTRAFQWKCWRSPQWTGIRDRQSTANNQFLSAFARETRRWICI